jgi:hypothetical protein
VVNAAMAADATTRETAVDAPSSTGETVPASLPRWLASRRAALPAIEAAANRRTDYLIQDALGLVEQLQGLRERARQLPAIFGSAPSDGDRAVRDQAVQIMRRAAAEAYALALEWDQGEATTPAHTTRGSG